MCKGHNINWQIVGEDRDRFYLIVNSLPKFLSTAFASLTHNSSLQTRIRNFSLSYEGQVRASFQRRGGGRGGRGDG